VGWQGDFVMHAIVATGAGFLFAVLWFDLMFDVQARQRPVSTETLSSIATYYRRVTIDAYPMNRLVSLVMLMTLLALGVEAYQGHNPAWLEAASVLAALAPMSLAMFRTVRNAISVGRGGGSMAEQATLALQIYRDHVFCLGSIAVLIGLQWAAH